MAMSDYDTLQLVATSMGLDPKAVMSRQRSRDLTKCRREVVRILRHEKLRTYPEIAALLGRHHTSVMAMAGALPAKRTGR